MNDLPNCMPSEEELSILFEDDTSIRLKVGNEEELRLSLETVALNVNSWFHYNRLIPNLEKPKFIDFLKNFQVNERCVISIC